MALSPAEYNRLAAAANKKYLAPGGTSYLAPVSPAKTGAAANAAATGRPSDEIANYIYGLQPDYSGIPTAPDYEAAGKYADERAAAQIAPYEANYARDKQYSADLRKQSLDASTNFTGALAGILTGGLEGQAGRDYALKTFGGSFLGEVQALQGTKLFIDITHDFNTRDYELLKQIDDVRAKYPEIRDQIYNDVITQEQKNIDRGIQVADSDYEHRLKAASIMLEQARYGEKADATAEAQRLAALTKVLVAKQNAAGKGSDPNLQVKVIGNKTYVFDPATGHLVYQPGLDKPVTAKTPAVKTFNSNGVHYVVDPVTGDLIPNGTYSKPTATATKPEITFQSVREDALAAANDLYARGNRPYSTQAFNSLMAGYGKVLLGQGVPRAKVVAMIKAVMLSAAGGRPWRGGTADSGGTTGGSGQPK